MTRSLSSLHPLFMSVALTSLLAACGGGSGEDPQAPGGPGSATPVPPPSGSTPPPPAPQPAGTGLSLPTLKLTLDNNDAVLLAKKMVDAGNAAAGAVASLALGAVTPYASGAASPQPCPGGGTVAFSVDGTGVRTQSYAQCTTGAYTFNGSATLTPVIRAGVLTSYTLAFDALQAAGLGSPPTLTGSLSCQAPTSAGAAPACISHYEQIQWGWDTTLTAAGASGTHQCTCSEGTWNVRFEDFTAGSGKAFVYATNGTADVQRTGVKTFTVVLTVEGTTQAFAIVLT